MRLGRAAAIAGAVVFSLAHIGSPDTIFEGQAGPYPIRVVIRTPGVVPGLADISIRITGGPGGVHHVTVLPVRGGLPTTSDPPPDTARVVGADPNLLSAQLWLMSPGAYSVQVTVTGDAGEGSAIVPVNSVATRRLAMDRPMALGLLALGLFLFVGAVTIVAAAVRESVLPPGQEPDQRRRTLAWVVAGIAVLLLGLGLWGGKLWWDAEDAAFSRRMYRPPRAAASVSDAGGRRVLRFAFEDSAAYRRGWSPLIPDHGKLMHLFLVGVGREAALAHLHPRSLDSLTFESALPPLPAGRYFVYADIVHETGFSQTLADTVDVPAASGSSWQASDPDDAWLVGAATATTMRWEKPIELRAGDEVDLRFDVAGKTLEPYMGMAGHAVIARDDGAVFVHLHPLGTIAAAAQLVYRLREPGDTVRGRLGRRISELAPAQAHAGHGTTSVSFPYAFPEPGRYRIWVQVKTGGRIETGSFEAVVL
jgi:hypothetical protein